MVSRVRSIAVCAAALALTFGLLGCDKLAGLGGGAKGRQAASRLDDPADPALARLVSRGADGLRLRRDLPLPATLTVDWERLDEMTSARKITYGAVPGRPEEALSEPIAMGKFLSKATLQRFTADRYTLTIPPAPAPEPPKKDPAAAPPPAMLAGTDLAGCCVTLLRGQSAWSVARPAGPTDFRTLNWGQSLTTHFDALLRHTNLTTSPRWLGDPLVAGREIPLSGADTSILLGSPASGELVLRYVGEESVGGHPCAAFSVTGRYRTEPVLHWHGQYESEEMVVESGRAYLSLLYPLVLGLDLTGILSLSIWAEPSAAGRPSAMLQGRTHRTVMAIPEFPAGWSPPPVLGAGG